jgi:hypothetical protein
VTDDRRIEARRGRRLLHRFHSRPTSGARGCPADRPVWSGLGEFVPCRKSCRGRMSLRDGSLYIEDCGGMGYGIARITDHRPRGRFTSPKRQRGRCELWPSLALFGVARQCGAMLPARSASEGSVEGLRRPRWRFGLVSAPSGSFVRRHPNRSVTVRAQHQNWRFGLASAAPQRRGAKNDLSR